MKRPLFVNDHIYHLYNRGVEKRNVFLDEKDHFRFIHDLFEFNDQNPASNLGYFLTSRQSIEVGLQYIRKPRKLLIEILAFCLMPNHYHLMVRQVTEGGVTEFMRKLGTGYTNYFNQKCKRVGALFQGKFKAVLIEQESHFVYLPYYIHFNPLDIVMPMWRESSIPDYREAITFLESYRWSSHLDYLGKKNFPSVTSREFLLEYFNGENGYKEAAERLLKDFDVSNLHGVLLE